MGFNDPYAKQYGETDTEFRKRMVRLAPAPVVVFQKYEPPPAIPLAVREAAARLMEWNESTTSHRPGADILLLCQHVLGKGPGCPRDTDGDGNCGQKLCPMCGGNCDKD